MVRTEIRLTGTQAEKLKRLAVERRRSMADLIRESVDRWLEEQAGSKRGEGMRAAARLFGRFHSGAGDLSARHDAHFAEASARRR